MTGNIFQIHHLVIPIILLLLLLLLLRETTHGPVEPGVAC